MRASLHKSREKELLVAQETVRGKSLPIGRGADPLLKGFPGKHRGLGFRLKLSLRLGLVEHICNPTTQGAGWGWGARRILNHT